MIDSASNRVAALPRVSVQMVMSVGTLASFGWLLLQDKIHPLVIYLLQVYLTF
ncbi:MAG: hypothetical protein GY856_33320 [bacterium]|nr:hypothetical protein [bacterium]